MAAYRVEKGIKLPPRGKTGRAISKYPWHNMEPGDSFFIPCEPMEITRARKNISSAGSHHTRDRPDLIVVTRAVKDGLRVWLMNGSAD